MRRKSYILIALVGGCIAMIVFSIANNREDRLIRLGNQYVAKINKYYLAKGKLPNSLSEVGGMDSEEGPIYYERKDTSSFILWFGTTVGESITYRSTTKSWE